MAVKATYVEHTPIRHIIRVSGTRREIEAFINRNGSLTPAVDSWLMENIGPRHLQKWKFTTGDEFHYREVGCALGRCKESVAFVFTNRDDALKFKLTWG